jgi:hypothetical protein
MSAVNAAISCWVYWVCTRLIEAGCCCRLTPGLRATLGLMGLGEKPPPQLGQTLFSISFTQLAQKVHS